jgi:hypothetical protein
LAIVVRCFGVICAATGSASQTLLHVFCTSRKSIKTVGTEVLEVGFGIDLVIVPGFPWILHIVAHGDCAVRVLLAEFLLQDFGYEQLIFLVERDCHRRTSAGSIVPLSPPAGFERAYMFWRDPV